MSVTTAHPQPATWLAHVPVSLFAVIMGLSGFTLALRGAEHAFGLSEAVSLAFALGTGALFVAILVLYAAKGLTYPAELRAEWAHPVRLAFFPAIAIAAMLLASASLGHSAALAQGLWIIGAALQAVFSLAVVNSWISTRSFQHATLNPAWFIPAVGNVIVPIAGVQLGYTEISWYFMSIGLVFWLVLLTLVMNRLIFHDPLPGKLQPTLVILIAPPAVAFVAWVNLVGEVDALARILLNVAYFFTLVVALQLPRILRLPFALSFWALSFPVAAVSIASFRYSAMTGSLLHRAFGVVLLGVLALIIAGLVWRTLRALRAGQVFVPE